MTGILTLCANYDEKNWIEQNGNLYNKVTQHIKPIVLQSVNNTKYKLKSKNKPNNIGYIKNSKSESIDLKKYGLGRLLLNKIPVLNDIIRDIFGSNNIIISVNNSEISKDIYKNVNLNTYLKNKDIYDDIITRLKTYLNDNGIEIPEPDKSKNESTDQSKYNYIRKLAKRTNPIIVTGITGIINKPMSVLTSKGPLIPNKSLQHITTQQPVVPISNRSNINPLYTQEYNVAKQTYDAHLKKLQVLSNQNITVLSQFVNNIEHLKLIENPTNIQMKDEITKISKFLDTNSYDKIISYLKQLILKTSKINPPQLNNLNDKTKFDHIIELANIYQKFIDSTS